MQYRFHFLFLLICVLGTSGFVYGNTQETKYSDEILKYRIQMLNERTPIEMEFNSEVKRYIDLFSGERREQFEKIIGLSKLYFPIYEEALDTLY